VISSNLKVKTSLCNSVHTEPGKAGKPEKYAIFTKSQGKPGIVREFSMILSKSEKS